MRFRPLTLVLLCGVLVAAFLVRDRFTPAPAKPYMGEPGPYPSDWFGAQRAFPFESIPQSKFREAVAQARADRAAAALSTSGTAALTWTEAGPFNVGGRVTAVVAEPGGATVYLAAANGGVWKSTNSGVNWTPVSDDIGIFSMGALALDPNDFNVIYAGTGEANSSVDSYDGNGLYRSSDAGASWQHLGLDETARIARVAVDPQNSNRIYVAAMGKQFSTDPHRGLYRSENGGNSWEKVLFVSDSTGAADIVINPAHPETVYCSTWERVRRPTYRRAYGPECLIWRSADHGSTWVQLSNGLPAPSDNVGRIGLAISPSQPTTIYAQIISGAIGGYTGLGLYRSDDGGENWVKKDVSGFTNIFGGFGWYFGEMAVNPLNREVVYCLGVQVVQSNDGGANFFNIRNGAHVDEHAFWIDPTNSSRIYMGSDGGFYSSLSGGSSWTHSVDLPITQFYAGTIDPSDPNRLLGGTQDNNTLLTSGSPSGWSAILGGDGFYCLVDPTNPNVILSEWQFCCSGRGPYRSTNGGASFNQPAGFNTSDRYNWNTPFVMDPNDHDVVLCGSQRVYKSTDNGVSYSIVSGDLTTNPPTSLVYGTLTTLDISPVSPLLYYAGTDDGKVWRSRDAGAIWEDISTGLPVRYVTRVTADPVDSMVVYVTHSGFGMDDHVPHVHRSGDRGDSWSAISSNLPDAPANDILVDPSDPQTLYLGTDLGVYATRNLGVGWFPLGTGMPLQAVFDLTLHQPSRTLVAATHGRSQWKLDLTALPVSVNRIAPPSRLVFAPARPNPSRGVTSLSLEVASATAIEIDIYDAQGRRVRRVASREFRAGRHAVSWDGTTDAGRRTEPGLYFIRAEAPGTAAVQRIVRVD